MNSLFTLTGVVATGRPQTRSGRFLCSIRPLFCPSIVQWAQNENSLTGLTGVTDSVRPRYQRVRDESCRVATRLPLRS